MALQSEKEIPCISRIKKMLFKLVICLNYKSHFSDSNNSL